MVYRVTEEPKESQGIREMLGTMGTLVSFIHHTDMYQRSNLLKLMPDLLNSDTTLLLDGVGWHPTISGYS